MSHPHTFAIIGAGAVGSYYGAKLAARGHQVSFYSRTATAAKVKKLHIKSIRGNFSLKANFYDSTNLMPPADFIIISLKALPTIDYTSLIRPLLKPESELILLQNGINGEEKLAKLFPHTIIHGGLAFTCINRLRPDLIVHTDYGLVKIAPLYSKHYPHAVRLVELFKQADIEAVACKKLRQVRWEKLLWNIPFNPLSVVLGGVTTDLIVKNPASRQLAKELMEEVRLVALADGCKITISHIREMLSRTDKMQPYQTSMLLDYLAGKQMETEAILGEPLKTAHQLKVATPKLGMLYQMLQFYAQLKTS